MAIQKTYSASDKAILRKNGLKATAPRLEFLQLLRTANEPLSITSIYDALSPAEVDMATIYRTVASLEEKGLLKRIEFQHGHAHYELRDEHHHHIICEHCSKIVDISKCDIPKFETQIKKVAGFNSISSHSLEFFGICNTCAKKLQH